MAKPAIPALRESLRPQSVERSLRPRHPSHKLTASIYCEVDGLRVDIEPLELSTAGLFVETPTPPAIDHEVEVFLRIGAMRFEASGLVVQTVSCEQARTTRRKPGYGLLFMHVDDAARAQLRSGIEALVIQRSNARRATPDAGTPAIAEQPSKRPVTSTPSTPSAREVAQPSRPAKATTPSGSAPTTTPKASAPAVAAIAPAEQALLDTLRSELRALDAKPPWSILGVSQGVDLAQAKLAFFEASKRYHPHLFARYAAPEIKQVVTQLFITHKRAYDTLRKSGKPQRQSVVDGAGLSRVILSKQPGSGNK